MATAPNRKLEADDSSGPVKAISQKELLVDETPHGADYRKLFAEESFMNEPVGILLHPTQDLSEIGIPVSVNGDRVYIIPNRKTIVKRKHVAQLMKARPDYIIHRSDDHNAPESDLNRMYRQSTSKYNFEILKDTSQGIAWFKELRTQYTK